MTDHTQGNEAPTMEPAQLQEWLEAFQDVLKEEGPMEAEHLLATLKQALTGTCYSTGRTTPYVNTIPADKEASLPTEVPQAIRRRASLLVRWNAMMLVLRAGMKSPGVGGHIASYASASTLYDVGLNYFFRTHTPAQNGDMVFIQGHSSPGIYARAYLEGRFPDAQMDNFRQESFEKGLSSYPHPQLMPDFWEFPTVSMGLGPMQAIFQARFLKYLEHRGLQPKTDRKVWCFCGDGEMDEPESIGAISIAMREKLDNLIFVINCNLQRLDGPVRGNSSIVQEMEGIFAGAGWRVLKVLWGGRWDALLEADHDGLLARRMGEVVDGEYQNYAAKDGAYVREHFFGAYPELKARVAHLSDDDLWRLNRGGHDPQKVFAAYQEAMNTKGRPTVILAKTIKGFGMGEAGEGLNITHQQKKMTTLQLKAFRDRFDLPLTDAHIEERAYYSPVEDSEEVRFLKDCRARLGGSFPQRRQAADEKLTMPDLSIFEPLLKGTGDREISSTMAFVRGLNLLLKDKAIRDRIVPIVPDESRTFGMEGMFRQLGIYSVDGQLYTPVDAEQIMYYREDQKGQILQEGLNEAGAFCSWIAAATSYSTHNLPMIPFYIYYSMFGFQRIGDFAWAAGDMMARGFLLGATSGRTTLEGEGLQHQDGHSHVLCNTIPNCVSYDPTYAYELAVIMHHGLQRMYVDEDNVYFYITVMNENYQHPAMPEGVEEGIVRGLYPLRISEHNSDRSVQLLSSGTTLEEALKAAEYLETQADVSATVWSATSFNVLGREAMEIERENRLNPEKPVRVPYVTQCLEKHAGPVIAATDYMRAYPEQIRAYVPARYTVLGTDGFGRSDSRTQLRAFFEMNHQHIAYAALFSLYQDEKIDLATLTKHQKELGIEAEKLAPWLS